MDAFNETVKDQYNQYLKAANEQPRDAAKICRLLSAADVSTLFVELFAKNIKELVTNSVEGHLQLQECLTYDTSSPQHLCS